MRALTVQDIADIAQYERERADFRNRIIEIKRHRRVSVGPYVTLVFENRDTLKFQIQEIMRAERIVLDERIQEEVDIYNELIPDHLQLSATLLIEVTDSSKLREVLDQLIGIDRGGTTFLVVGDERIEGFYEEGQSNESRISAVHYVRFAFTPEQAKALDVGGPPLSVVIDHPNYQAEAPVPDDVRASLAADLTDA